MDILDSSHKSEKTVSISMKEFSNSQAAPGSRRNSVGVLDFPVQFSPEEAEKIPKKFVDQLIALPPHSIRLLCSLRLKIMTILLLLFFFLFLCLICMIILIYAPTLSVLTNKNVDKATERSLSAFYEDLRALGTSALTAGLFLQISLSKSHLLHHSSN